MGVSNAGNVCLYNRAAKTEVHSKYAALVPRQTVMRGCRAAELDVGSDFSVEVLLNEGLKL